MKTREVVITNSSGLHARPAGALVKEARMYQSTITLSAGGKSAEAAKLMALMGMCIKTGTAVTVTVEGADEVACAAAIRTFMENNL